MAKFKIQICLLICFDLSISWLCVVEDVIEKAVGGVSKIIHILPSIEDSECVVTKSIICHAQKNKVEHLVKLSCFYNRTRTGLVGKLQLKSDDMIKSSGIPYTILCANETMSNFTSFFGNSIRKNNYFELPLYSAVSYVSLNGIVSVATAIILGEEYINEELKLTSPQGLFQQMKQVFTNSAINLSRTF